MRVRVCAHVSVEVETHSQTDQKVSQGINVLNVDYVQHIHVDSFYVISLTLLSFIYLS